MYPDKCPECGADFQGEPIPESLRNECYGGATHYSRVILVKYLWDRPDHWSCPDCGHIWKV